MSVMLYDLTASVAQMCAPVPAAATGGWTDWLDHWQTLLGVTAEQEDGDNPINAMQLILIRLSDTEGGEKKPTGAGSS